MTVLASNGMPRVDNGALLARIAQLEADLAELVAYVRAQHHIGLHDNWGEGLTCRGCQLLAAHGETAS